MKVEFLAAARQELTVALQHYKHYQTGLDRAFGLEIKRAVERIERFPKAHPLVFDQVRCCHTRRFPYKIVYLLSAQRIVIIAVAHHKRRPDYWKTRLSGG